MSVFLTYHTLEERETEHISSLWKSIVIVTLLIAIGTSVATSYSMYSLTCSFKGFCFLYSTPKLCKNTAPIYDIIRSYEVGICLETTTWGRVSYCEFAIFMPLIHAGTSTIWLTLFMIFGRGGASEDGFISKPWCIIFPASLYFFLTTAISIFFVGFVHNGLLQPCLNIASQYFECSDLLNELQKMEMNSTSDPTQGLCQEHKGNGTMYDLISPKENYVMIHVYMYIACGCYMFLSCFMIFRCLCVTDFKLVRVTISSYESESVLVDEESSSGVILNRNYSERRHARFSDETPALVGMELGRIVADALQNSEAPRDTIIPISKATLGKFGLQMEFQSKTANNKDRKNSKKND